jgi:hypothetical protein
MADRTRMLPVTVGRPWHRGGDVPAAVPWPAGKSDPEGRI